MEVPQPETTENKLPEAEITPSVSKNTLDTVEQLSIKESDGLTKKVQVSDDMEIDLEIDDSKDESLDTQKVEETKSKKGGTSKRGKTGKTVATRKPRGKKTDKVEEEEDEEQNERVLDEKVVEGNEDDAEIMKPVAKKPKRKPTKTPAERNEPAAKRTRKKTQQDTEILSDSLDKDADGIVDESSAKPKKKRAPAKRKGNAAEPKGKAQPAKGPQYDPEYVRELKRSNSSHNAYWQHFASPQGEPCEMISEINESNPLHLMNVDIRDEGPITGMTLSPDGTMLVTFCNLGATRIWDVETFKLIRILRDAKEPQIDEMYVGTFTPDCSEIAIGGKLKDRHKWSEVDDDNHILNCPLKIFDTVTGEVISRLEGHTEEVICVKLVRFKDENYYITTSQDGHIIKWRMEDDYCTLIEATKMDDGLTCMAFTVSFAPGTGNKYFMAACDEHLRLYDFEEAKLLQTFENIYSQYCDCGKFVECVDLPSNMKDASDVEGDEGLPEFAYFVSRGVEEYLDLEDIASRPNTCTLHKLIYPTEKGGHFKLEEVKRYHDKDYVSNSWLIKISSNGRYLMAPGMNGQVVSFNIETGDVTAVLRDHEDLEIRDVIFHPTKKLLFTSGDDGCVKVYTQTPIDPLVVSETAAIEMNGDEAEGSEV